jgi:uncharacterized protein
VLRVDDRGVGGSTGSRETATTEDFAEDALAGVEYLNVAFIAMLAGRGVKGTELLLMQAELISQVSGVPIGMRAFNRRRARSSRRCGRNARRMLRRVRRSAPRKRASGDATMRTQLDVMTTPWMRHFLSYDPAATLKRVRVRVLAVNGLIDLQVPARQNLPAIEAALKAGGNSNLKIVELRDLNHLFQKATTGSPAEYATIEETINLQALAVLGEWVVAQTR